MLSLFVVLNLVFFALPSEEAHRRRRAEPCSGATADIDGGRSFVHTLPTAVGSCSEVCSSLQFCPHHFCVRLRPFFGRRFWNAHIGLQSVLALQSRNRFMKGSGIVDVLSSVESHSCQRGILLSVYRCLLALSISI